MAPRTTDKAKTSTTTAQLKTRSQKKKKTLILSVLKSDRSENKTVQISSSFTETKSTDNRVMVFPPNLQIELFKTLGEKEAKPKKSVVRVSCPYCNLSMNQTSLPAHKRLHHGEGYIKKNTVGQLRELDIIAKVPKDFSLYTMNLKIMIEKLKKKDPTHQDFLLDISKSILKKIDHKGRQAISDEIWGQHYDIGPDNNADEEPLANGREDARIEALIMKTMIPPNKDFTLKDVVGLDVCVQAILNALELPVKSPQIFRAFIRPMKGMLLYGPPGNGKSFLAKAVASQLSSPFFSISLSDLANKYFGIGEKTVKKLFEIADKVKPCIIFVDEIDSFCASRSKNVSECMRGLLGEFLIRLDGVGSKSDGVLVLAATNLPHVLDDAILRRFERRFYVRLPDQTSRKQYLSNEINKIWHELYDADFDNIASETEGYSMSDLKGFLKVAMSYPIKRMQEADFFRPCTQLANPTSEVFYEKEYFVPCPSSYHGSVVLSTADRHSMVQPDILKMEDAILALGVCGPSVNENSLAALEKFTSQKGQNV